MKITLLGLPDELCDEEMHAFATGFLAENMRVLSIGGELEVALRPDPMSNKRIFILIHSDHPDDAKRLVPNVLNLIPSCYYRKNFPHRDQLTWEHVETLH